MFDDSKKQNDPSLDITSSPKKNCQMKLKSEGGERAREKSNYYMLVEKSILFCHSLGGFLILIAAKQNIYYACMYLFISSSIF
jgi:hypothetical protein